MRHLFYILILFSLGYMGKSKAEEVKNNQIKKVSIEQVNQRIKEIETKLNKRIDAIDTGIVRNRELIQKLLDNQNEHQSGQ